MIGSDAEGEGAIPPPPNLPDPEHVVNLNEPFPPFESYLEEQYEFAPRDGKAGGARPAMCKYCGKKFKSSLSRRVAHLLQMPNHGVDLCPKLITDGKVHIFHKLKGAHEIWLHST